MPAHVIVFKILVTMREIGEGEERDIYIYIHMHT